MLKGIEFPNAKDVLIKRLKKDGIESDDVFNAIDENSALCRSIDAEIEMAKMSLSNIFVQLSLLLVPVSIPSALKVLESQLPITIKMLENLEVDTGGTLSSVEKSMNTAKQVLKTAGAAFSNPILAPLKIILGF